VANRQFMETQQLTSTGSPSSAQIAHVLFLDIVKYSEQSTPNQARSIEKLNAAVNGSETYQREKAAAQLMALPTGDGMAILFTSEIQAPAVCAVEIWRAARQEDLKLRIGIHSGLVQRQLDIAGNANVAGEGINTAQRVLDLADEGHILLSSQYAAWLSQFDEWQPYVHLIGEGVTKHGVAMAVSNLYSEDFGNKNQPSKVTGVVKATAPKSGLGIVLLYRRNAKPDDEILAFLEAELQKLGYRVFIDRHLKIGVEWAKAIEDKIRSADAVVALVSDAAAGSEMLEFELETAFDEYRRRGKPFLLPVRVGEDNPIQGAIGALIKPLNYSVWLGPQDNQRVLTSIHSALTEPPKPKEEHVELEPVGGAISEDSPFYIERSTDPEFLQAIRNHESIILVKGPRQMGKTSLIGRGAKLAKELGLRQATTDFQKLSSTQLENEETFYKVLAATLARQLRFQYDWESEWLDVFGPNMNMDNFVRAVIEASDQPLVWFMDEADKLFGLSCASDFFGLVRSWHNSRATEPGGPWSRFTVVIGYATEAHLFIQDLNQSPFNVGRQLVLRSFTLDQTEELNKRHGSPIKSRTEVEQLQALLGGQPFLTRRAYDVLARGTMDFQTMLAHADRDDGPFGDHLKRVLISVSQLPEVLAALRASLESPQISETDGFQRLLAAGVVEQDRDNKVVFVNELYPRYLSGHL
jgi:hypothetical protein